MTGNTLIYCYQNGKLGSLINLYTNRKNIDVGVGIRPNIYGRGPYGQCY